jgi:hypothetical protein
MGMIVHAALINSNVPNNTLMTKLPDEYQTIFNSSLDRSSFGRNLNSSGYRADYDFNAYIYSMIFLTRHASLIINSVLIVVGVLVNTLVILVFCRAELRKLTISIYTLSLAVSDMCLLSVPVFLKWLNEFSPELALFKTSFWCKTHGYLDIAFCCWSAWNIVALSSERWMVICRQSNVYMHRVHKRAVLIVVSIPLLSLLSFMWYPFMLEYLDKKAVSGAAIALDEFMTVNSYEYNETLTPIKDEIFCRPSNKHFYLASGIASITISYLIPFVLITFFNSRIVNTLNKRIAKRKEYFGKSSNYKFDENLKSKKRGTQSIKGTFFLKTCLFVFIANMHDNCRAYYFLVRIEIIIL